jgi:hypothetical protein
MIVLITRQLRRFVARLLVGALIYAQLAIGAYACPPPSFDAVGTPGVAMAASAMMLEGQGADVASELTWHMDSAQPGLCVAHCQSEHHQNIDVKPAPSPVLTLMAGYFIEPNAQGARHGRPAGLADSLPPQADPPHAILHCCFRI